MNLTSMLRQTCTWQVWDSSDVRDTRTYAASTTIKCRAEQATREVMGASGDVQISNWKITTLVEPSVGDLLNGREVISVVAQIDWSGATVGWVSRTT